MSIHTAIAALTSFVATNLDDLLILMVLFSGVHQPSQIVCGQYLGFTMLVLASLPGFFGGAIIPKAWLGLLGILPIIIGIKQLLNSENNQEEVIAVSPVMASQGLSRFLSRFISPQVLYVAAVTIANGGDNISIYLSLFASSSTEELVVTLGVFFVLVGVWCAIAYQLVRQPLLAKLINRYGSRLAPWALIGLGIYILLESKSYSLLR